MANGPNARPTHGIAALSSAVSDLAYEWWMAHEAAERIRLTAAANDVSGKNMALESFCIHARNIRAFFDAKGRKNDVLSRDFFGRPMRVRLSRLRNKSMRRRIDRRIAHLSFSRSRLKREFPVKQLLTEIDGAMFAFLRRLEDEHPKLTEAFLSPP